MAAGRATSVRVSTGTRSLFAATSIVPVVTPSTLVVVNDTELFITLSFVYFSIMMGGQRLNVLERKLQGIILDP